MPNTLLNTAQIEGLYGDESRPIDLSSNDVEVMIVDGLSVTKSADKNVWADGSLRYTITITNDSGNALTGGVLSDELDTTMVALDGEYGVKIDGLDTSDYRYDRGILTVNLPDIQDGQVSEVTFQVVQNHS